jgi:NADPH:quinone reductase-like Zn-dependent oxidoreductase
MPASSIPQTWYACLVTLPHLGITGSRYYPLAEARQAHERLERGHVRGKIVLVAE